MIRGRSGTILAFIDHIAASTIRDLRESAGLNSQEQLASAIRIASEKASWREKGTVDAWTIRKIEQGHVPGPRIRFVLASYFGREAKDIWQARNWQAVETSVATGKRKQAA